MIKEKLNNKKKFQNNPSIILLNPIKTTKNFK